MLYYASPAASAGGVIAAASWTPFASGWRRRANALAMCAVAVGFGMFYLIEIWREKGETRFEIPIGLLAGFCFAIKYTGFVAGLYALVIMRRRFARMGAAACVMALPWLVKNWIWMDNPVSPFFNRVFANPYIHVSFEESYRRYLATYGLPSL